MQEKPAVTLRFFVGRLFHINLASVEGFSQTHVGQDQKERNQEKRRRQPGGADHALISLWRQGSFNKIYQGQYTLPRRFKQEKKQAMQELILIILCCFVQIVSILGCLTV